MYFITIKRMLEVCFSAHPNIQYRAIFFNMHFYIDLHVFNFKRKFKINTI